jgi:hypothetical protein
MTSYKSITCHEACQSMRGICPSGMPQHNLASRGRWAQCQWHWHRHYATDARSAHAPGPAPQTATRSPLPTPPSSVACQAVGSTSDSSTTFLSGMPSGTFRQFRSAAVASPCLNAVDLVLCSFSAYQISRRCTGTRIHHHISDDNPPCAHGLSHTSTELCRRGLPYGTRAY